MPQLENNFEYELLNCIIKKNKPAGASSLALNLNISQATIGRKLHELEFHSLLGKISGNKILGQMVNLIMTQSQAYLEFSYIRKKYSTAVTDHEDILKFFFQGDPDAAGKSMVKHIDRIISDVKKYFSKDHDRPFKQ